MDRIVVASLIVVAAAFHAHDASGQTRMNESGTRTAPPHKAPSTTTKPAPTSPATKPAASSAMRDSQIAMIALTAHQIDVERSKLAQKVAKSPEVKHFADAEVNAHTSGLAAFRGGKQEESDVSRNLKSDAADTLASLNKLRGAEFDKSYIEREIAFHQNVLGIVDRTLLPNVQTPSLKTAVQTMRGMFNSHLQRARQLQVVVTGAK